jgi:hypothetical protein
MATESPHPPFGDLLPFFEREKGLVFLFPSPVERSEMGEGARQGG